jgi:hypothetical protein
MAGPGAWLRSGAPQEALASGHMFSHPVPSQEFLGALAGEQLTDASRGYDG